MRRLHYGRNTRFMSRGRNNFVNTSGVVCDVMGDKIFLGILTGTGRESDALRLVVPVEHADAVAAMISSQAKETRESLKGLRPPLEDLS